MKAPTIEQLAAYYLDCLSFERQAEVSAWARSKYGKPDYVEIPLELFSSGKIDVNTPDARQILKKSISAQIPSPASSRERRFKSARPTAFREMSAT